MGKIPKHISKKIPHSERCAFEVFQGHILKTDADSEMCSLGHLQGLATTCRKFASFARQGSRGGTRAGNSISTLFLDRVACA